MSTDVPVTSSDAVGPRSAASTVRRVARRAAYDAGTVHAILDAGLVAHVGLVADDGRPVVIPMIYGRDGDRLYLHGSVASRLTRALAKGVDLCVTVTLVDGLVLARSTFHHSMNYRSVVVLGQATPCDDDDKRRGLRAITEHLVPGRWAEARQPNRAELKQTTVLGIALTETSAKVRTGDPVDDDEDLSLPVWAGVIPLAATWGVPVAAADLGAGIDVSSAATALSSR